MKSVKDFSVKQKNNNWLKFLIGAVVLLFLLFILNLFVAPVKNTFYALSSPIQKIFWSAGESSSVFLSSLSQAGSLTKENEDLKNQNQKLLSEVASLQSIEQGNQAQSDVSAACQNNGFKTAMAKVNGLNNDYLSINVGSAVGIFKGMPVINQQNALVGKIFEVYKNFSQVMLVSNKNSVVSVKIQQSQGDVTATITGSVKGAGGLSAYLDFIPINSEINPQNILVTSALDGTFPENLLVGTITKVQKNDQKPFQQAQISLFFNVEANDNLFVITNYKQAK